MIDSLKIVNFKGKKHLINKMPICIKNKNINWVVFLFFILVIFAVTVFCFADLDRASDEFIEKTVGFIVLCAFILLFFLMYTVKSGSFVLAADEKGIYYRIYGRKDDFMLIEWRIIAEVVDSYSDGVAQIDVLTVIKIYDMPAPCNAVTYKPHTTNKWLATKNITISFIMPNAKKSATTKLRLDELRVKSQNALLA